MEVDLDRKISARKTLMNEGKSNNQAIVHANLMFALGSVCQDSFTVGGTVTLDTEPPLTPDIVVGNLRPRDWLHDEIRVTAVPLTAIEIIPPSQSVNDLIPKVERYFEFGTQSVWLVLPPLRQVAIFTPDMDPQVFSEVEVVDPTPDVKVALAEIFS